MPASDRSVLQQYVADSDWGCDWVAGSCSTRSLQLSIITMIACPGGELTKICSVPIWKLAKGANALKCSLMPGQLVTQHNP